MAASVAAHGAIALAFYFLLPRPGAPPRGFLVAYLFDPGAGPGSLWRATNGGHGEYASVPPAVAPVAPQTSRSSDRQAPNPRAEHKRSHHRSVASRTRSAEKNILPDEQADIPGSASSRLTAERSQRATGEGANNSGSDGFVAHGDRNPAGDAPRGSGSGADRLKSGTGSFEAYAAYGQNPRPAYPNSARRRGEQGTVWLRVQVAADGHVTRVELLESSGFDSLDRAAVETVRSRWRFIAARHDGVAVDSWVRIPIRFQLTEAQVAR